MRVSHTSNTARSRRKAKKRQSLLRLCLSLAFAAILCVGVYAAVSAAFSNTGKIQVDSSSSSTASVPILSKNPDTGAEKAKDSDKTLDLPAIVGRDDVEQKEPLPNSDEKLIALTFDDGPSADSVAFVEELNALGVRCTFFMQGYLIEAYPDAAKAMVAGGHQIASHTYDHPNLATSSNSTVMEQIDKTEALLSAVDGKENHYLRCPYGESSDFVRNYVKSPIIYWSVDSEDWRTLDREAVCESIVSNAYDGAIVLAHEIYETSRTGSIDAIKELQAQGYTFVTVEELLKRRGVQIKNGETYFDAQNEGVNLYHEDVDLYFGSFAE